MSRRKAILKRIAGHEGMIAEHEAKIARELQKPAPNENLVALWRKQIANAQTRIARLRSQLSRR